MLVVEQIATLQDNYVYFLLDKSSGKTAVVDPGEVEPILRHLKERGCGLDFIFNTHHHPDHVGGNLEIQKATGCEIWAPLKDRHRIPGAQKFLSEGDTLFLGESEAKILDVPGHTIGHIAIYFAKDQALFSGDMIFSLGSGFLFEGTPAQMWHSLERLRALPDTTVIYGAHEYTLDNAKYALYLDPENQVLLKMVANAKERREKNLSTVPSTLAEEKAANPFLRADSELIQAKLGKLGAPLEDVFASIRYGKDAFDRARR